MERHVAVLLAARQCRARSAHRIRAEHRHVLEHDAQAVVLIQQFAQGRHDATAVGAAIIEKLDHGHVAVRIAPYRGEGVIQQLFLIRRDCRRLTRRGRLRLLALQLLERVEDDLRFAQQILAHDLLDLLDGQIGRRGRLGARQDCRHQRDADRQAGSRHCSGQSTHGPLAPFSMRRLNLAAVAGERHPQCTPGRAPACSRPAPVSSRRSRAARPAA